MAEAATGLLDTNVVVHALANDEHSRECRAFLHRIEEGRVTLRLEAYVLHELTYTIPSFMKQLNRSDVATILGNLLEWSGVSGETELYSAALMRWRDSLGLAFVDAMLAETAARQSVVVVSKNVRELRSQGATVTDPLNWT